MEQLKTMKETLISQVQNQIANIHQADAKELGEAIDMIKDISEAIYYCTIVKSMEEKYDDRATNNYYYTERYYDYPRDENKMYYPRNNKYYANDNHSSPNTQPSTGNNSYYHEYDYPIELRDSREGRSPNYRRMYMEAKETHQTQSKKIQELESYLQELTTDIMDMIADASPEEKSILQKKMNTLATKLQNV